RPPLRGSRRDPRPTVHPHLPIGWHLLRAGHAGRDLPLAGRAQQLRRGPDLVSRYHAPLSLETGRRLPFGLLYLRRRLPRAHPPLDDRPPPGVARVAGQRTGHGPRAGAGVRGRTPAIGALPARLGDGAGPTASRPSHLPRGRPHLPALLRCRRVWHRHRRAPGRLTLAGISTTSLARLVAAESLRMAPAG